MRRPKFGIWVGVYQKILDKLVLRDDIIVVKSRPIFKKYRHFCDKVIRGSNYVHKFVFFNFNYNKLKSSECLTKMS